MIRCEAAARSADSLRRRYQGAQARAGGAHARLHNPHITMHATHKSHARCTHDPPYHATRVYIHLIQYMDRSSPISPPFPRTFGRKTSLHSHFVTLLCVLCVAGRLREAAGRRRSCVSSGNPFGAAGTQCDVGLGRDRVKDKFAHAS